MRAHAQRQRKRPPAAQPQQQRPVRRRTARPAVQAKLTMGAPGDAFEQEADRVSEQVMRMPDAAASIAVAGGARVQRKCAACEAAAAAGRPAPCPACAAKAAEGIVRRKANGGGGSTLGSEAAAKIRGLRGGGMPLPARERAYFEPRFASSFEAVRIHTGHDAADAAASIRAKAFTHGHDVAFNRGQYAPDTDDGRRLLAHELTHVVQQRGRDDTVRAYRDSKSANFGACNSSTLAEKEFTDKDKDPWIEKITVHFDGTKTDSGGDTVPTGKLDATYFTNAGKLPDLTGIAITGGKASQGLSDQGSHKAKRIEGCGYHHTSVPKADRLQGHKRGFKYFEPSKVSQATMSFAVFFVQGPSSGNQAIHEGSLSSGSLACVHVGATSTIRQINYHSRVSKTGVEVSYDAATLKTVCCERHKAKGYMVSNPCKGQKASECP